MRILLAEDDKKLNESLTNQLISRGFSVDSCYDGKKLSIMPHKIFMTSYCLTECYPIWKALWY